MTPEPTDPGSRPGCFFHQSIVMELVRTDTASSCPSSVPPWLCGFPLLSYLLWGWGLQNGLAIRGPGPWVPQLPTISIPIADRSLSFCRRNPTAEACMSLWEHWLSAEQNGNRFCRSAEPSAALLWRCPDGRTPLGVSGPL